MLSVLERSPTRDDDAALCADLAAELDGGFERLVAAYQHRLYAFALRLTGSSRDAEEAAQDAFVRAYGALGGYSRERILALALRPWLYQVTLNLVRNQARARSRRPREAPLAAEMVGLDPRDPTPGPEDAALLTESQRRVARLLATLPARYRAPLALRYVADLTYEETAAALVVPVGTVKTNVHRGIALLRSSLSATPEEITPHASAPLAATA